MSEIITIEKLIIGGAGLGRLPDGMVVLVPQVLPGEVVRVEPVSTKKNFMQARLVEILEPSVHRAESPCPYYGQCGGCDFQHIDPDFQAQLKNDILREQLERTPFRHDVAATLTSPLPSPHSFHYRQRIRLQVGKDGELGFHRLQSHEVEDIDCCLLARQQINDVLAWLQLREEFYQLLSITTSLEILLSPEDEQVVLLFHLTRKPRPTDVKRFEKIVSDNDRIKSVVVMATGFGMVGSFSDEKTQENKPLLKFLHLLPDGDSLSMSLEPGGFSQVNLEQNDNIIALVLDWLQIDKQGRALDLFCGMGNFSLPLAEKMTEVVGMDLKRSTIRSAKRNGEANQCGNAYFSKNSAVEGATSLVAQGERFELILLDPPRQGCAEVIPLLPQLKASQIIYISCDPATLCRDLLLLEKEGYRVEKIKMVDMFPQTHHLETVVSLRIS